MLTCSCIRVNEQSVILCSDCSLRPFFTTFVSVKIYYAWQAFFFFLFWGFFTFINVNWSDGVIKKYIKLLMFPLKRYNT